jgi:hypothetical protein
MAKECFTKLRKIELIAGFPKLFTFNKIFMKLNMTNEELVKKHTSEMIENLIRDVASQGAVEIRFEFEDNDQWSVISMHIYDEDKEISLRLHANDRYELYLGYYDDQDEFFEITQPLSSEEKKIIPKALQKVMGKVLTDERGMRVPGNLLTK